MSANKSQIIVYATADIKAKVLEIAEREGTSESKVALRILKQYFSTDKHVQVYPNGDSVIVQDVCGTVLPNKLQHIIIGSEQ